MNTTEITIRSIQNFLYCPHQWGLMKINRAWAENVFVTRGILLHNRVHDADQNYSFQGKQVFTAVPVYNDREEYNLYGVVDCLELREDANGVPVKGRDKRYHLCIVEYKPTKPKTADYREEDLMQVFAQKICVDYVFGGDCSGVLYYANVRKRISLPLRDFFDEYDQKLKDVLATMREYLVRGQIPAVRRGQKCSGCSMQDMCMPSVGKKKLSLTGIRDLIRTDQDR